MTEIEKIAYTKSFIDKLANGINPVDNTAIPETDIMNNVRLVRCMFYVSDILRQVIDNGGITAKKKNSSAKKAEFSITDEQMQHFEYSDEPIPVSEIAHRFNNLIDTENMKKISYNSITAWLINLEMLEEYEKPDGKKAKRPTESGENMGIIVEMRYGQYGPYQVTLYDRNAQEFIVDNINSIISHHQKKNAS